MTERSYEKIRILNSKIKKRNKKVKNQKKYQGKDSVKLNS